MKSSTFFHRTRQENPIGAVAKSHILMIKSGMIHKGASGIYNWLPYGHLFLKNISSLIERHMNSVHFNQILASAIQPIDLWKISGRDTSYGSEMLIVNDRSGHPMVYAPTCEEQITDIVKSYITSYSQFPVYLYQVQLKFRDEIRPRFGLIRSREFLMKDAYSFDLDKDAAYDTYKKIFAAYCNIFNELGLRVIPVRSSCGEIGGDLSHEFVMLSDIGESGIFHDDSFDSVNAPSVNVNSKDDINDLYNKYSNINAYTDDFVEENNLNTNSMIETKVMELGQLFYFGSKYTESMSLKVQDSSNNLIYPVMGSYGIGVSRLAAAIVEHYSDSNGLCLPKSVAPFTFILTPIIKNEELTEVCNKIYSNLCQSGMSVLFNDIKESPGSKLKYADLTGIPYQINLGKKFLSTSMIEVKNRATGEIHEVPLDHLLNFLSNL